MLIICALPNTVFGFGSTPKGQGEQNQLMSLPRQPIACLGCQDCLQDSGRGVTYAKKERLCHITEKTMTKNQFTSNGVSLSSYLKTVTVLSLKT